MGIDINQWQGRIGTDVQPGLCAKFRPGSLNIGLKKIRMMQHIFPCVSLILILAGDVELNPGPGSRGAPRGGKSQTQGSTTSPALTCSVTNQIVLLCRTRAGDPVS